MSEYSESSPGRGSSRGKATEVDATSQHEQHIVDGSEGEVDQDSQHSSVEEVDDGFADLENDADEDAENDTGADSDGSEDLPIEVVENTSKHVTNFRYEERGDVNAFLHVDNTKTLKQRQVNSLRVPALVLKPGELTEQEQDTIKYYNPQSRYCYWKHGEEAHFASHWMNEEETKPCHQDIKRLQDLLIEHKQSTKLPEGKKGGGLIFLGISVEQAHNFIQPHSSVWPPQRRNQSTRDCTSDPVTTELVKLVASIAIRLLEIGLPPRLAENIRRRAIVDVSFPAGNEDNVYTSHLQCNISLLDQDLTKSIGAGGGAHVDKHDDFGRVNIVFFLSHLPPDYCPGKFLLLSDRTYCITAPYTALISTGAMPHWPIAPKKYEGKSIRHRPAVEIPAPSESPDYRRISAIAYPNEVAMRRATHSNEEGTPFLKPIMHQPGSLLVYGTQRNQKEYWARLSARAMQKEAEEQGRQVDPSAVDRIRQQHSWVENGKTRHPRRKVVSQTLFGPGESETDFNARDAFVRKHINCGRTLKGTHRRGTPVLLDEAGDEIPKSPKSESESSGKGKKSKGKTARASKKRGRDEEEETSADKDPVDDGEDEYEEPPQPKKARKASRK